MAVRRIWHHACRGTGRRRVIGPPDANGELAYEICKGCNSTGFADTAFVRRVEKRFTDEQTFESDIELDWLLEVYVAMRYGKTTERGSLTKRDARIGQTLMVLQHALDREALRTVARLGDLVHVFAFIVAEEHRHMRGMKARDFW